jgi:hypothetical protein
VAESVGDGHPWTVLMIRCYRCPAGAGDPKVGMPELTLDYD